MSEAPATDGGNSIFSEMTSRDSIKKTSVTTESTQTQKTMINKLRTMVVMANPKNAAGRNKPHKTLSLFEKQGLSTKARVLRNIVHDDAIRIATALEKQMDTCTSEVCENNISRAGEIRRYRWATFFLLVFFAGLALFLPNESIGLRAVLLAPLSLSAVLFFQAREHTCVMLAGVGNFEGDDGYEKQKNSALEMSAIRSAQDVWAKSILAVLLVGSAVFSIP